jgi:hypothetical protein
MRHTTLGLALMLILAINGFADIFAQNQNARYRIQVLLLCDTDFEYAKMLSHKVEEQLGMKTSVLAKDNCFKIVAGNFTDFQQAITRLDAARVLYKDAWITAAYEEYEVYPLPEELASAGDLEKLTEATNGIRNELSDIKGLMNEFLLVAREIKQELEPKEEAPVIDDLEMDWMDDSQQTVIETPDQEEKTKKMFWKVLYAGGVFIDLHASNADLHYANYYGYCFGIGGSYAFNPFLSLDLTADYNIAKAEPIKDIHEVTGDASVLRISPSLMIGSNIYNRFRVYGKLGTSYFNYDYSLSMTLKPGQSNGPSSIDAELLQRADAFGLQFGAGAILFRYVDLSFMTYYDNYKRRYHAINLGVTF